MLLLEKLGKKYMWSLLCLILAYESTFISKFLKVIATRKTFWQFLIKFNIWPNILLGGIYPREMKTQAHTKKLLCNFSWSSTFRNNPTVHQLIAHPYNGFYLAIQRKKQLTYCNNMDEAQNPCVKWMKPDWKGYILYDSIYVAFWKG